MILKLFNQDLLQLAHSLLYAAPHFLQDTGLLLRSCDRASRVLAGSAGQELTWAVFKEVLPFLVVAQCEFISSLSPRAIESGSEMLVCIYAVRTASMDSMIKLGRLKKNLERSKTMSVLCIF